MVKSELTEGIIFDIQGFSVHDGPGCRTLIFFKGCKLHCEWCSNPEGIGIFPEPLYKSGKCTFDRLCMKACQKSAITINEDKLSFDRVQCAGCETYDCVKACCSGAVSLGGYRIALNELYAVINRDRAYWGAKGGITLTGGEPFLQPDFVHAFLKRCYEAYIHTAAETCGNFPWENIASSLPFLDWIFFDLKHMDPEKHLRATGSSNHQILKLATRLANEFRGRMVFRMPVIPDFNDDESHIDKMASFILSSGLKEINILPVHHFGREKYPLVERTYYTSDFSPPSGVLMNDIQKRFENAGIQCYVGSDTPF